MFISLKKSFLFLAAMGLGAPLFCTPTLDPTSIQSALQETYDEVKMIHGGKNADYIPELAKVNPNYFGITIITVDGTVYSAGNTNIPFAIESVIKPFAYALALKDRGAEFMSKNVGLNATGQKFNSIMAIEQMPNHIQNPLVNAGAIQVASAIKGKTPEEKWNRILSFTQDLSDGNPYLGENVYQSETSTNQHNQAIAKLLQSYDLMFDDPLESLDVYTKECSIMVTAEQLALMGATFANKGMNPLTKKQVIEPEYVQGALSMMTVAGLYENSGEWWFKVGLPAKSGVGGGIVAVLPGKMAIAVFSPPLDDSGNSVRGQAAIEKLSKKLNLHVLAKIKPFLFRPTPSALV
jgi:glutaminase